LEWPEITANSVREAVEAFTFSVEQEKIYSDGGLSDSCLTSMRSLARMHVELKHFAEALLHTILDAALGFGLWE
jgi:hypothetical protein